jgi:hypothetical protein
MPHRNVNGACEACGQAWPCDTARSGITADDPLDLLDEWLRYWWHDDHMPNKMPDALHVRTAVVLTVAGRRPAYVGGERPHRDT